MVSPPHCACVLYTYMYSAVLAASSRPPQAAGVRVNKEMQITPRCIFYCRRRRTHPHLPPLASIQVTKVYYFSNCPSSSRMSLSGGGNTGVFYNCTCFTPCFNPLCFRFFSTGRTVRTMTGAAVLNSTFFFPPGVDPPPAFPPLPLLTCWPTFTENRTARETPTPPSLLPRP